MTATDTPPARTGGERLLHAVLYELVAIVICAPVLAWLMHEPLGHMGALTVAISVIALSWNVVFNIGWDRLRRRYRFAMTFANRLWHGLGFEGGLILFTVPLAAWWLGISLWQAFLLDAAILLFFLPYTVAFNWIWDLIRERCTRGDRWHRRRRDRSGRTARASRPRASLRSG